MKWLEREFLDLLGDAVDDSGFLSTEASALAINAAAIITHDRDFSRVHSLRVIS